MSEHPPNPVWLRGEGDVLYVIGPSGEPDWPSSDPTIHINSDGKRVYPCRCGQTHSGDYGVYDWGHHNCFHNSPLHEIDPENVPGYLMCPACGKTFWIEQAATTTGEDQAPTIGKGANADA